MRLKRSTDKAQCLVLLSISERSTSVKIAGKLAYALIRGRGMRSKHILFPACRS